ncbi:unnamed protein product [Lathyrus oleraceus]
MRRKNRLSF